MAQNIAFMNDVMANGGVITDEIRERHGIALPEPDEGELTPESIQKMSKKEVAELLVTHGVEDPPKGVDDMRALAVKVVFSDL